MPEGKLHSLLDARYFHFTYLGCSFFSLQIHHCQCFLFPIQEEGEVINLQCGYRRLDNSSVSGSPCLSADVNVHVCVCVCACVCVLCLCVRVGSVYEGHLSDRVLQRSAEPCS